MDSGEWARVFVLDGVLREFQISDLRKDSGMKWMCMLFLLFVLVFLVVGLCAFFGDLREAARGGWDKHS